MVALMLFAIESHSSSHREWPNSRVQPDPPERAFFFANASGGGPVNLIFLDGVVASTTQSASSHRFRRLPCRVSVGSPHHHIRCHA